MKEIIINSPKYGIKEVLVDDEDYDFVMDFNWYVIKYEHTFYARRNVPMGKLRPTTQSMHRYIMGDYDSKMKVDHRDHNGLNNQKSNLRLCTHQQNLSNRRKAENGTSKFKGVSLTKMKRKAGGYLWYWVVRINVNYSLKETKLFPYTKENEAVAARYYDSLAKKHFGDFANLNFKE